MIKYTPTPNKGTLEPGEHVATVKTANESFSRNGDQTVELELSINGFAMRDTLYATEKAAWRIAQARACFGFIDSVGEEVEFEASELVGCTGKVRVELGAPRTSGKHEGKRFLEVREYLPRQTVDQDIEPF